MPTEQATGLNAPESTTPSQLERAARAFYLDREAARRAGTHGAAHDLRRTFARLAHKDSGKLDQIQLALGHAGITTTERYLGVTQDLQDAPCDHLGLRLE